MSTEYKSFRSAISSIRNGEQKSTYTRICNTIRGVYEQREKIEKHEKDQLTVGTYTTKNFEMQPKAQLLYNKLPNDTSPADAEKAAILQDKLFNLEKYVTSRQAASPEDIKQAEDLKTKILHHAKAMNLEKEHSYLDQNISNIKNRAEKMQQTVDKANIEPELKKRFTAPPYERNPEPKKDMDLDSKKWLVRRSIAAQRKIKIIDGD